MALGRYRFRPPAPYRGAISPRGDSNRRRPAARSRRLACPQRVFAVTLSFFELQADENACGVAFWALRGIDAFGGRLRAGAAHSAARFQLGSIQPAVESRGGFLAFSYRWPDVVDIAASNRRTRSRRGGSLHRALVVRRRRRDRRRQARPRKSLGAARGTQTRSGRGRLQIGSGRLPGGSARRSRARHHA